MISKIFHALALVFYGLGGCCYVVGLVYASIGAFQTLEPIGAIIITIMVPALMIEALFLAFKFALWTSLWWFVAWLVAYAMFRLFLFVAAVTDKANRIRVD